MEYTYLTPPEKANDGWMGHRIKLFLKQDRFAEFTTFLETYCGEKGKDWRLESRSKKSFWIWGDEPAKIRFKHKKHAALLKLQWVEDTDPMEDTWNQLKKMTLNYPTLGSIRPTGKSMASQAIGRGIRNTHVTTVAPPTNPNPLPWYGSIGDPFWTLYQSKALSRKSYSKMMGLDYDSIYLDTEASISPYWLKENLEDKGHTVMTTQVLKERLNGTGSKSTTVCWSPETLRLRDEVLPDSEQASGLREGAGNIPDHQIPADGGESASGD
jgi:hypothetical protein